MSDFPFWMEEKLRKVVTQLGKVPGIGVQLTHLFLLLRFLPDHNFSTVTLCFYHVWIYKLWEKFFRINPVEDKGKLERVTYGVYLSHTQHSVILDLV